MPLAYYVDNRQRSQPLLQTAMLTRRGATEWSLCRALSATITIHVSKLRPQMSLPTSILLALCCGKLCNQTYRALTRDEEDCQFEMFSFGLTLMAGVGVGWDFHRGHLPAFCVTFYQTRQVLLQNVHGRCHGNIHYCQLATVANCVIRNALLCSNHPWTLPQILHT